MINPSLPVPKPRLSTDIEQLYKEPQTETLPKKLVAQAEAMKCFCRIRPSELKTDIFKIVETSDDKILSVNMEQTILQKCGGVSSFTFTKIFNELSTQSEVFESTCNILIEDIFKNKKGGLIFTYGMTNAGKTFTVVGINSITLGKPDNPGILPLSLKYIYETISNMESKPKVSCNFIEIYNEEIFDLLSHDPKNPKYKRKVYIKDREKRFVIQDITNVKIENLDDFSDALNKGISKKAHSSTNMNQNSSRSHTIFKILVNFPTQIKKNEIEYEEISLSIVDLAGSERQNRTEAQGKELQEACKINQSLSVLGKCMEALRYNSLYVNKRIVPFRESKLTMLFQEYFQGDQNIIMITNINPRREDFEETMRALNYSCVAKEIKPIKSKILNFNKKKETVKVEQDESLSEEKNVIKNLNEIFSENKNFENNLNTISFSEGRNSFYCRDEIDSIKSDLELFKRKCEDSQNIIIEYEKKIETILSKYEEIKSELTMREQYGRVEAIKEMLWARNNRPKLVNGMFQIGSENREAERCEQLFAEKFNEHTLTNFPSLSFNKDDGKINILMIQPNFNDLRFVSNIQPTTTENFVVEAKNEKSTVQINITNSNNQIQETNLLEIVEVKVNDKKDNKNKKNKKKNKNKESETSFRESFSNIDTTDLTLQKDSSVNESAFSEISNEINMKGKKKNNKNNKNKNKKKNIRKDSISPIKEQLENSNIYANEDSVSEKEISLDELDKKILEDEEIIPKNKKKKGQSSKKIKINLNESEQEEEEPIKKKTRTKNKKANFKKYYR